MSWYVYILRCSDNSFYTGITTDIDRRIRTHNLGKGAAYTRSRRPVKLIYRERKNSVGAALSREIAIKRLTRIQKENLIWGRSRRRYRKNFKKIK